MNKTLVINSFLNICLLQSYVNNFKSYFFFHDSTLVFDFRCKNLYTSGWSFKEYLRIFSDFFFFDRPANKRSQLTDRVSEKLYCRRRVNVVLNSVEKSHGKIETIDLPGETNNGNINNASLTRFSWANWSRFVQSDKYTDEIWNPAPDWPRKNRFCLGNAGRQCRRFVKIIRLYRSKFLSARFWQTVWISTMAQHASSRLTFSTARSEPKRRLEMHTLFPDNLLFNTPAGITGHSTFIWTRLNGPI